MAVAVAAVVDYSKCNLVVDRVRLLEEVVVPATRNENLIVIISNNVSCSSYKAKCAFN